MALSKSPSKHTKLLRRLISIASILLVLTVLTSCLPSFDFQAAPIPEPVSLFSQTLDLEVTQARLTKLNPPGVNSSAVGATMNLFVGFDVLNGSENFVTLRDVDYVVYLAGYQIDSGRLSEDRLGISENAEQRFEFPINLNIQNRPELLNQALQILEGNSVPIRVQVKATTEDDLRQNLQANRVTTSSAKILAPEITLLDLQLVNAQQILLEFQAENTGSVGYILSSQNLNLRQNTQPLARGDIFNIQMPAQTTTTYKLTLDMQNTLDRSQAIEIATDWLYDVLGADSFRIRDWFLRQDLGTL